MKDVESFRESNRVRMVEDRVTLMDYVDEVRLRYVGLYGVESRW